MKLYVPSWNGDFRLEQDGTHSTLVLHQATPHELGIVERFLALALQKGHSVGTWDLHAPGAGDARIAVAASLAQASKLLLKVARPRKQALTAVVFSGGQISVVEGTTPPALEAAGDLIEAAAASGAGALVPAGPAAAVPSSPSGKGAPAAPAPAPEPGKRRRGRPPKAPKEPAAASVRRPTPSCPQCMPGAVGPATEALLAFLDDEEHDQWQAERAIAVVGGTTGHRYLLAHRHTPLARKLGRVCYDLDDGAVVHFHDWSVPPEEEILAAKLILEHREHWLRNEATCLGRAWFTDVLPNPFGGLMDGVPDASFTQGFGAAAMALAGRSR